jgi:tetratricopeptide (TPR) repeat protein
VRTALITLLFLFCYGHSSAQQDYFYAETLINNGQYAEGVRVLDHLIDSGAYADRPRFQMMTLNLAGNTKLQLHDTAGGTKCFEAALACYDTLTGPRKSDDWNHCEYYKAGERLAVVHYRQGRYAEAATLLRQIGCPGAYYSATGRDLLLTQDHYHSLRAKVFQKLNQPDSAFASIRSMRDKMNRPVRFLDSIFNVPSNTIQHVQCVGFNQRAITSENEPGYLYFVAWVDETHTQNAIWFVNPAGHAVVILGRSTNNAEDAQNFPANCYAMSLSPDEKYLAVECYTEGSNTVQVISFPEMLAEQKCNVKYELVAYPAALTIKGWLQSQLCLESEADLTKLNKKGRLQFPDYPGDDAKKEEFLFDPESGKYSRK